MNLAHLHEQLAHPVSINYKNTSTSWVGGWRRSPPEEGKRSQKWWRDEVGLQVVRCTLGWPCWRRLISSEQLTLFHTVNCGKDFMVKWSQRKQRGASAHFKPPNSYFHSVSPVRLLNMKLCLDHCAFFFNVLHIIMYVVLIFPLMWNVCFQSNWKKTDEPLTGCRISIRGYFKAMMEQQDTAASQY